MKYVYILTHIPFNSTDKPYISKDYYFSSEDTARKYVDSRKDLFSDGDYLVIKEHILDTDLAVSRTIELPNFYNGNPINVDPDEESGEDGLSLDEAYESKEDEPMEEYYPDFLYDEDNADDSDFSIAESKETILDKLLDKLINILSRLKSH